MGRSLFMALMLGLFCFFGAIGVCLAFAKDLQQGQREIIIVVLSATGAIVGAIAGATNAVVEAIHEHDKGRSSRIQP